MEEPLFSRAAARWRTGCQSHTEAHEESLHTNTLLHWLFSSFYQSGHPADKLYILIWILWLKSNCSKISPRLNKMIKMKCILIPMLLQRLVHVLVLWNSKSFACNSIFVLELSIWIMMGHLIFSKDGAIVSTFLVKEILKDSSSAFQQVA